MANGGADPDDEKGGSQIVPDKPEPDTTSDGNDHEQDREGASKPAADHDHPDSF